MDDFKKLSSLEYLQQSKLQRSSISSFKRPEIRSAPAFKNYPKAERIPLPRNWDIGETSLTTALSTRRSVRKYADTPLSLETLGYLLWASQGISAVAGSYTFRTAPSAGALYPVETYLSIHNVKEVPSGIYHFNVADFELEKIRSGNFGDDVAMAFLNQRFLSQAPVVFLWSGILRRNFSKYGNRGLRYVLMDAGHICQNVLLAAEAASCCGCAVAAFFDEEVNEILEIDGEEEVALYGASIGYPSSK